MAAPSGPPPSQNESFRVAFVPGVTPDKWARIWTERIRHTRLELLPIEQREQLEVLQARRVEMAFVRLPIERDGVNLIPLYRETPVVVVSTDHPVAVFEEVSVRDLADEELLQDLTTQQAIESAAAGIGIVIVPLSVARLHHRKDVVHRPVTDIAESQIGLAWRTDADHALIETFIGIVRGRTERSSR